MTLFGRSELPSRAALSRFLKALDQSAVEALRTLFQKDLVALPLTEPGKSTGGLWEMCVGHWVVIDVDGTRQAARPPPLPCKPDMPLAHQRRRAVLAPHYQVQS